MAEKLLFYDQQFDLAIIEDEVDLGRGETPIYADGDSAYLCRAKGEDEVFRDLLAEEGHAIHGLNPAA